MRKTLSIAYTYSVTALAFIMTIAPAIIRADAVPTAPQLAPKTAPPAAAKTLSMKITAYSSSPDQTDSTPFITANGTPVHDGIVATNVLPMGTKIEIPSLFGNKIFTVQDRMNQRMKNVLDIWMPTKTKALRFGVQYEDIVIVRDKEISER